MLRLFSAQGFHELCKCNHRVASCVTKRKVLNVLPVDCHHRPRILARHFNTRSPLLKDALEPKRDQPEQVQKVDLDKWKFVMRSQAASEEKQVNEEEEAGDDDDGALREPGGDLKDSSSLEATRDLVVMWREAGKMVPQEMTEVEVRELAGLTTKSSRKKYLKFLAIKEGLKKARKEKQQQRKAQQEASIEQSSNAKDGGEQEGPELQNTLFLPYRSHSLDTLVAWRSAQAMVFGQPLVFDMSYESNMTGYELRNTVSQLMTAEGCNRRATEPYHLHFCNLHPDGAIKQELLKRHSAETWDRLFITSTHRQHIDVFPREQLVYLTADSPNVLRKFDHSKVYIIGALVDRSIKSGLSLANAKRLKLATARLPLDEFLHWERGAKNLTLDQMMLIMITLKETGKWEEALKFVPKRKHDGFYQQQTQKMNYNKARGVTNQRPREDGDRLSRSGERIFKNEGQSLYRSPKQSGFTGRDKTAGLPINSENKPAATRVRTSFKNNMEDRKGAGKRKMRWYDE